jgi:CheY-like chemotaxis protein
MPHGHRPPGNGRVVPNGAVPQRRKVVLVVEDNASVGGLVAGLLRQDGYRAVRAWDPQEAVRLARGRQPDAIVLDLNLAYPNGLHVLRHMRAHEATRRPPVVVVAGSNLQLSSEDAQSVEGLVHRPFDIDVMLNAVRKALGDPLVEVQPRQYDATDHYLHGY